MVHFTHEPAPAAPSPPLSSLQFTLAVSWQTRLLRLAAIVVGLAAWFTTQHLIAARPYTGTVGDGLLDVLTPFHTYLFTRAAARNALLIASSAGIDCLGVFIFARAIFGPSIRPFIGLLMLFALRQSMQALCVLPMPDQMIWPKEGPGFPSLLVTYGVGNDLFFSGHSALAVFGAVELARYKRALMPLGIALAIFEIFTVLALRAHWTMDVYAGIVTAFLVAIVAQWIAPAIDRALARHTSTTSPRVAIVTPENPAASKSR